MIMLIADLYDEPAAVDRVLHFCLNCPFLSLYQGTLWICGPGNYRFFTSSQD